MISFITLTTNMKVVCLIILICFGMVYGDKPSPNLEISFIADCQEGKITPPNGVILEAQIDGEGPSKSLNAKVELPFDVDDSLTYQCTLKKWEDNEWEPIPFQLSGKICEHAPLYLPRLWEKLSKIVNVPNKCPIKSGSYTVKGFKAESSDVNLPFTVAGKYLVTGIVLKDDTPIICKQAEVTISQP